MQNPPKIETISDTMLKGLLMTKHMNEAAHQVDSELSALICQ